MKGQVKQTVEVVGTATTGVTEVGVAIEVEDEDEEDDEDDEDVLGGVEEVEDVLGGVGELLILVEGEEGVVDSGFSVNHRGVRIVFEMKCIQ